MRSRQDVLSLLVVLPLLTLPISRPTDILQGGQAQSQGRDATNNPGDDEIRQAFSAIESADEYREIVSAIATYEQVFRSSRVVELADAFLQSPTLDAAQRTLLMLERQLALDCQRHGAATAARRLSVRLIALHALSADSPQQFANELEKFAQLAKEMTVALVREALDTREAPWPDTLLPLMEGLARDWAQRGALAAATRMAEAAAPVTPPAPRPAPERAQTLVGHWRSTRILFDTATDEHLVVRGDGTAETWSATASGRQPPTRGRWRTQGSTLSVEFDDGRRWSQPFTFYEGQLVFPNVANQRQFWELID